MALKMYEVDWKKLVTYMLPVRLRGAKMKAWLLSLIAPVSRRYAEFYSWSTSVRYYLQHTGQVIYLEKVLNEEFAPSGYDPGNHEGTKDIYITDGENPERDFAYLGVEDEPIFLNPSQYIETNEELLTDYTDFFVNVPAAIPFDEGQMKAIINKYKLAGKIYKIRIV